MALPFALTLMHGGGWSASRLATFQEAADLWTFWRAWSEEVKPETKAAARFEHTGRAVRYMHAPSVSRDEFFAWASK